MESALGSMGRGKREERSRPTRAFYFFRLLLFLLGYPAGASTGERAPTTPSMQDLQSVHV